MEDQPPSPPPPSPSSSRSYKLTATSLTYIKSPTNFIFQTCTSTPPTHILKEVSLTAYPSQILAVVGPSGAGKSTLLDILAARTAPSTGQILINNNPINPSSFRKLSAYVPQHDQHIPCLTVFETFVFNAKLLKPRQIEPVVNNLLTELRLSHVKDSMLSNNLSGGERRRVSIGLSLLHDPCVLFLDEPTSRLDSESAFNVIQILKSISISRNSTIVLSIHQPSFKILSIIDRFLLLSKGVVVHHGTLFSLQTFLFFSGFKVPPQLNPLEYTMEILNEITPLASNHQCSPSSSSDHQNTIFELDKKQRIRYKSSRLEEISILCNRFWKIIYRTRQFLLTNALEALIVGLVLGTIYINIGYGKQGIEKRFGLFAFTLTFLLSSTTDTLPIFINERPIILQEISSGVYRLSSYLIANTLIFIPYLFSIAIIFSVSLYFLVGLCGSIKEFSYFVLVIWIILLMANSFVLFLSSLAPNYIAGTSLVTILLGGFFLFSGYFISEQSIPKFWLFMHFLSMYKYALDALLINEYSCLVSTCLVWFGKSKESCVVTGGSVMKNRGLRESHRWIHIYFLIGFFLFYRFLCFLVLIRRVSRSKK